MPSYVYECPECGHKVELIQKISERSAPDCDKHQPVVKMQSVITTFSFALKGSCWAKDGYSRGNK